MSRLQTDLHAVFDVAETSFFESIRLKKISTLLFWTVLTEGDDFLPVGDAVCVSWGRN